MTPCSTAEDVNKYLEGRGIEPVQDCTLSPDEAADRMAWIRKEVAPHVIAIERLEHGLAFELAAVPGLAATLDRLIAIERECCSGIVLKCVASRTPCQLRLEVDGIDPDAAVFRSLGGLDAPVSERTPGVKTNGTHAIMGVVACCVLPVAADAVFGAVASHLYGMDATVVSSLVAGVGAWWWLWPGRVRNLTPHEPVNTACGCGPNR